MKTCDSDLEGSPIRCMFPVPCTLQYVVMCCSVLQIIAMRGSAVHCVAVCVAERYSVWQSDAECRSA